MSRFSSSIRAFVNGAGLAVLSLGAALGGTSAYAQSAAPIVEGKHLQPKGMPSTAVPSQNGAADADRLLQQGAHSPAVRQPPVVPRDLYGQPMGDSPGLSPPDPDPHVEKTPPQR